MVRGLYPWTRVEGDIYHLSHDRSPERIVEGEPGETASPDYIRNALLVRRYMIAAIRDHGVGDLPGEEHLDAAQASVHIRNLRKDDRRFLGLAARSRMPESVAWRDWWPKLRSFATGRRAQRQERERERIAERGITLVVLVTAPPRATGAARLPRRSLAAARTSRRLQKVLYPAGIRESRSGWSRSRDGTASTSPRGGFRHGLMRGAGATANCALWALCILAEDDFRMSRRALGPGGRPRAARRDATGALRRPGKGEIDRGGILAGPETFTPVPATAPHPGHRTRPRCPLQAHSPTAVEGRASGSLRRCLSATRGP
jgi:hypothetical protein